MTHPVRLSALAALDIQQAREWHDAREPGLGDQFLQRVDETMTRIGQNPFQYQVIAGTREHRRAPVREFPWGLWYRVEEDSSVVVACLAFRQDVNLARRCMLGKVKLT